MNKNKDTYKKMGMIALAAAVVAGIIYLFYRSSKKRNPPAPGSR